MAHMSSASASSAASIAQPRPPSTTQHGGWRQRLWCFLFPDEESAGVEGAALHYGHHASATAAVMGDAMEPWHYMQVPLSRVIIFLRLQQRLADQWVQGWMYAPFYVFLLLFVFVGPGRGAAQTVVDFDATRRASLAQASLSSTKREAVLMEAFRLDTESTATTSLTNSVSDFVSGNSARYPWCYSWYNDSVNAWTPPPKRRLAVDAQVKNVAAVYHEPVFLSLTSIRSRRDVLRWLQLQLVPRLWNCRLPGYERPWRDTVTGDHYQLGAVRLISRRYQQKGVISSSSVDSTVQVTADSDAGETSEGGLSEDEHNAAVATPQLRTQRASPPEIPETICGADDNIPTIGVNPGFDFDSTVGGYVALLPFASSCYDASDVLEVMQTPTKSVLWPPAYNRSLEMRRAWMMYTETNRVLNTSPAATTKLCSAFIFEPAVSEVVVQYVEYGTKTNQYTVVEVSFTMSSGGAVVRPRLTTLTLHALQWRFSFTPLAFSITLAMTIIFYGNYLVRRMLSQYARKLSRISRQQRSRSRRAWCALRVLSHTQNFVHLIALCMTAAAVGSWWHSLVSLTGVPDSRYADRELYPESIDAVVRRSSVLLPRLSASAVFFATAGLLRFASATPGLWLCVQTLARSVPRLLLICCVWMTVNVGVTIMCVLLYGGVLFEFSSFEDAFTMLLFAFLDGGRSLLNSFALARQTGHTAIFAQDNSLPGIRGSRLGRIEPVPLDQRAITLAVSSHDLYVGFLLFFFYAQNLIMFVWGVLTILESYRGVLLLPEAEALPLWRGVRTLQFSSLTRIFSAEYAKEALRRLLLARGEAVMLREIEYFLRLGYARAPATAAATSAASSVAHHHHHRSDGSASETAVSLPMVLWLLPRELQPEYGAAHLRRLWYLCVAAVVAAQRSEQPWKATRWRQHWEQQPSSLSGWMHASLPADDRIEGQAARVGLQLEELPNSVVRYVEGKFM